MEFTCSIAPLNFADCCNQGAVGGIICYLDVPRTTVEVKCTTQEFTLLCYHQETKQYQTIFQCGKVTVNALCGSRTTIFSMETTLTHINGVTPFLNTCTYGTTSQYESALMSKFLTLVIFFLKYAGYTSFTLSAFLAFSHALRF